MKPSTRHVLERLRQGPATTHDLCQPDVGGLRFGARLLELREAGFEVSEERLPLPTRGSLYRLVSEPENFPHGRIPASDGRVHRESTGGGESRVQQVIERPSQATEIPGVRHAGEGREDAEPHGGLFDAGTFHHSSGFGDAA